MELGFVVVVVVLALPRQAGTRRHCLFPRDFPVSVGALNSPQNGSAALSHFDSTPPGSRQHYSSTTFWNLADARIESICAAPASHADGCISLC